MQRESKSPLRAKRFSMSITHQRIIPTEERQEGRHGSVTRNAGEDEAGLSNCGANGRAFQGCVRFKSLEDLALDVVGRTVARVSAEEHMANYRAARALLGKEDSELRNSSRARRVRERGSSAKKGAKKSAVKKAKPTK